MNFFVADVETGFGPFISVYLAANGWGQGQIGLMLTAGSVCGIASQLPGGAIVDGVRSKRAVVALALIAAGGVILFLSHAFWWVLLAQVVHGLTAGLINPESRDRPGPGRPQGPQPAARPQPPLRFVRQRVKQH